MKFFQKGSPKRYIIILVLVSGFILFINTIVIYQITNIQSKRDRVINIAGRQRMLTQKMTKEILLISNGDFSPEKLLNTINEFQNNLEDLKYGNADRNITPTENKKIMNQQQKVTKLWKEFKTKIQIIIDDPASIQEKEKALEYIKYNNINFLKEVDKAVDLYEKTSIKKLIRTIQIIIFIIGTLVLFISWRIINKLFIKSERDQLTKLYNKAKFNKRLEEEIERINRYGGKFGLVMFDIDYFKKINDNYGHAVGDKILLELTDIFRKSVRNVDFFARWGGDEFMIITPNTNLNYTMKLAERLKNETSKYDFYKTENLTCSFGVTSFKEGDNVDSIIKRVDNALYKAKNAGRNKVIKN
jgi:diguanylate cyclase (GGDEF)-like protein